MSFCRFILSDEDLKALKDKCEEEKITVSDLLRDCVADFLGYPVGINGDKTNRGRMASHIGTVSNQMASHASDGQPSIYWMASHASDGQPSIYWMASHAVEEANTSMAMILQEEGYTL